MLPPKSTLTRTWREGKKLLADESLWGGGARTGRGCPLAPDDPQVHILLAQALEAEGKHHEAVGGTSDFTEVGRHRGSAHFPGARLSFHESAGAGSRAGTGRAQPRSRQPASGTINATNPGRSPGGKEDALSAKILRAALLSDRSSRHRFPSDPLRAGQPRPRWWRLSST